MPNITFQEVYDKSFENDSNEETSSALKILWRNGVSVFEKLYGPKAQDVIRLCYDVSPRFCLHVVTVVYGMHWNWDNPSFYQKSLATNLALILERSFNQFKVLMLTFLHSAREDGKNGSCILLESINYMAHEGWLSKKDLEVAKEIIESESESENNFTKIDLLSDEDKEIAKLAAIAVLRKEPQEVGLKTKLTMSSMQNLLFHLNTYIGCPRVWDASMKINPTSKL